MANPIAKEMSKDYGISSRKAASILDTFSCVFQGILPYGAQMLVAIAAASGLGETVNAFEISPEAVLSLYAAHQLSSVHLFRKGKAEISGSATGCSSATAEDLL